MNIQEINAITKEIAEITKDKIGDIYVSGGCVLDMILGYTPYDVDVFIYKDMDKSIDVLPITISNGITVDVVYTNVHPLEKMKYFDFPIKSNFICNGELTVNSNLGKMLNEELIMYPNKDVSMFRYIKAIDKYGFTPDEKLIYILNNYLLWKYRTRRPIRVAEKYRSYLNTFIAWAKTCDDKVNYDLAILANELINHNKSVINSNHGEYKTFHDYYKYI